MNGGLRACVLRAPDTAPHAWEGRLTTAGARLEPVARATFTEVPPDTGCVFVDGQRADAVDCVKHAHRTDPALQAVIVAPADRRRQLEREVLFAPGIGEVWIVAADEVDDALLDRAADVTGKRRRHRTNRPRLEHALATLEPRDDRRSLISDAYLASLLDAAPGPMLSIDEMGRVLSWNPGAQRVLGYDRTEAIGRPLAELLATGGAAPITEPGPETLRTELRFRRRNGDHGIGECTVVPVAAIGQRVWAVIIHDVTEMRRAQQTLERQAAELEAQAEALRGHAQELERVNEQLQHRTQEMEQAASSRSRFYAAMSHELRTPINAIMGYNSLVLDGIYGEVPDRQRQALERANRAASHLLELINDVLDLAKIEAGRIELQPERTCSPQLIEELLDTVRSLADRYGSTIELEGPGRHCIDTDPRRVRQILLNLLSNAIKFGRGRPITVRWRAGDDEGLEIDVVDRGDGIAPEHLERIFEEFTQLSDVAAGGTGLGLPISRQLATALGGRLEARSELGTGSTFRLRLPPSCAD